MLDMEFPCASHLLEPAEQLAARMLSNVGAADGVSPEVYDDLTEHAARIMDSVADVALKTNLVTANLDRLAARRLRREHSPELQHCASNISRMVCPMLCRRIAAN